MEVREVTNQSDYSELWHNLGGHLLQSWEWGEIKRPAWEPLRLLVTEGSKPIAVVSIQVRTLGRLGIRMGYCPKLRLPEGAQSAVWKAIEHFLRSRSLHFVLVEPDIAKGTETEFSKSLKQFDYYIQPQNTIIVDTTQSQEQLWANLKSSARRTIGRSERLGIQFEVGNTDNPQTFERFFKIMDYVLHSTDYVMHPKSYFLKVWDTLSPKGMAEILFVTYEGRDVGSYMAAFDNTTTYELYGGTNEEGKKVNAGNVLRWNSILHTKAKGKSSYDVWGTAPLLPNGEYDPKHQLYGVSRFKAGFGGQHVEFANTKVMVFNQTKFLTFSLLYKLQRALIKFKKLR